MVRKANCLLLSFPTVRPDIQTRLFRAYCLSLYGSSLWQLSSPALSNIEIAFNKVLRKIWQLPNHSHTGIVHSVAALNSIFNIAYLRSLRLISSVTSSSSSLVKHIFSRSSNFSFTFAGYNYMYGHRYLKKIQ